MYVYGTCLFYVCCSVGVCGNVCCVVAVVKNRGFSLGVLKYVVCLCSGCDGCYVFCLYCEVWICRCLMFNLSGPCELFFLLCFIVSCI